MPNSSIHEIELAVKDDPATSDVDESTWADNGNNASVAQRIEDADIVWMNGGAQSRHVQVLMDGANNRQDTDAMAAVRQTVNCQGGVVGGSSAGAAVAGADIVGSGDSYGAMRDGISTTDTYGDSGDFRAWATQGLGLLPDNVMTGTHFQQRARTARLVRTMWHEDSSRDLTRQDLGFGIGENTVLVFEGGTTRARVIGENGVTVFDIRNAEASQSSTDPDAVNIKYVEVHYLSRYDEIDYGGSSVTLYPDTTNKTYDTVANPYYSRNSNGGQWIENTNTEKLMTEELIDNSAETVSATEWGDGTDYTARGSQGVRITYYQMSDSTGHWGDGYADGQGRYFVGSIELDIESIEDGY